MPDTTLKAGVGTVDITPSMGVEMAGYGPYEKRVCTEVLDPLYAKALYLESGGNSVLIITVDLCTIDRATRDEVARKLHEATDIPETSVMVAAIHTHSGPSTQLMVGWGQPDASYMAELPDLLVRAGVEAQATAGPAKLGACRTRITGLGINREQPELGPTDTAAQLLRVDREDGSPLAVVFNFGMHAVARYPLTNRVSADWPGLVAAYLEVELPGATALFLQGCCGNLNPHPMNFGRGERRRLEKWCDMQVGDLARRLGDQIIPAVRSLETRPADIAVSFHEIELPTAAGDRMAIEKRIAESLDRAESRRIEDLPTLYQRQEMGAEAPDDPAWRRARYDVDSARAQLALADDPDYRAVAPVQLIRLGHALIVGWPGEIFVELGLELRQRSPFPLTFVASFANGNLGYIPTRAAYESQGRPNQFGVYPVGMTPNIYAQLPFRPNVAEVLVEQTLAKVNGMR